MSWDVSGRVFPLVSIPWCMVVAARAGEASMLRAQSPGCQTHFPMWHLRAPPEAPQVHVMSDFEFSFSHSTCRNKPLFLPSFSLACVRLWDLTIHGWTLQPEKSGSTPPSTAWQNLACTHQEVWTVEDLIKPLENCNQIPSSPSSFLPALPTLFTNLFPWSCYTI